MQNKNINDLLTKHGLVCCSFAFNELSHSIQQKLHDAYPADYDQSFISLLANGGSQFWQALTSTENANVLAQENPVDNFSISIAMKLIDACEQTQNAQLLYPGYAVPLIQLGQLAHWSTPSPLGLGLHPTYGPWFAFRALIKSSAPLQDTPSLGVTAQMESPCLSCADTPCIRACPASATNMEGAFDIQACAAHRLKKESSCKTQCHARNACPVGEAYRYSEDQREYHMTHALDALEKWAKQL